MSRKFVILFLAAAFLAAPAFAPGAITGLSNTAWAKKKREALAGQVNKRTTTVKRSKSNSSDRMGGGGGKGGTQFNPQPLTPGGY